jgi:hypothetical protein
MKKGFLIVLTMFLAFLLSQTLQATIYEDRFMELWNEIHDPANGYLSSEGIPYHCIERLIVEAVDYGHMSTSEAISEMLWLDAVYARYTGDWSYFRNDWSIVETYFIPSEAEQRNFGSYNPSDPADFCPEYVDPYDYPAPVQSGEPVGQDPIYSDLSSRYGTYPYLTHWFLDVDDWLGFGNGGPTKVKLFERGPNESTWETVPHPAWDEGSGNTFFADIFVQTDAQQWRYTVAPDAELRMAQVMYLADRWASEQGVDLSTYDSKMKKMGDWLRYVLFDKYFRVIGENATAGTGYQSCHYLVGWYTAWGAGINQSWAWRIGCHTSHFGYNNPMGALWLSNQGVADWGTSLDRQLELVEWLQCSNGAIGGGVSNRVAGETAYDAAEPGPFHGMHFVVNPVYKDPGSNTWMGYQTWFIERLAQYYYETGDATAGGVLQKWMDWVKPLIKLSADGDVTIPVGLGWEVNGQAIPKVGSDPRDYNVTDPSTQVTCITPADEYGHDIGIMGSLAKCLILWSRASGDSEALTLAEEILNRMWDMWKDDLGVAPPEERADYSRFYDQVVPIPSGVTKTMPWGATIDANSTFNETRPDYGETPQSSYNYHRTWQQIELATGYAYHDIYAGGGTTTTTTAGTTTTTTSATTSTTTTAATTSTTTTAATTTTTAATGCTCDAGCDSRTTISTPFTQNGAGEYCWEATSLGDYINSWVLDVLEVNGIDYTNTYCSSSNLPAKIDGVYYVYYKGSYPWSHFEAVGEAGTTTTTTAATTSTTTTAATTSTTTTAPTTSTTTTAATTSTTTTAATTSTTTTAATTTTTAATTTTTAAAGCTCDAGCDSRTTISVPFTQNGAGEYCWETANLGNYINSWNLDVLEINGVDYTNKWSNSFPEKIDGVYYIYYKGSYPWSHFEAR